MARLLEGSARGQGALTIKAKKYQRRAPWEAVLEVRKHSPSTQKMSMVGPLGGTFGGPGAPTINAKNIDGGPPGGGAKDL
jgi:hypothetical protein